MRGFVQSTTFAAVCVLTHALAWISVGLVTGFGYNVAGRFSMSLVLEMLAITTCSLAFYLLRPEGKRWLVSAVVTVLIAELADFNWYLTVGLNWQRLVFRAWEWFLPAALAVLCANRVASTAQRQNPIYYP